MRGSSAPEARGSIQPTRRRLAGWIGLSVLTPSALAQSPFPSGHDRTGASGAGDAAPRRLLAASGDVQPNFTLPDLGGIQHELTQRAGRVVLVHFFATWCEPCREELSSLSRLLDRQGGTPTSIVAVNVAEVPARVRRFLDMAPVRFPVLLDADRAVTKAWGVSILPTTFVLDRALVARLFVEGDLDWSRADVLAALDRVGDADRR